MLLEILVCTCNDLTCVAKMKMPAHMNVRWRVSCQVGDADPADFECQPLPDSLNRDDITVEFIPGIGVSRNRNYLLSVATGDYIMLADDDLEIDVDLLVDFAERLERDSALDFVGFRVVTNGIAHGPAYERPLGVGAKPYLYLTLPGVVIRRTATCSLRFKEYISIGNEYITSGEDDDYLYRLQYAGAKGVYVPVVACKHLGKSTAERRQTPGVLRGRGYVLQLIHGNMSLPRIIRLAFTLHGQGFFANLRYMLQGRKFFMQNPE